jgi:hypothetical protein
MICQTCQKQFTIEPDDRDYYARIQVPEPVDCPNCRRQLRSAWRCERSLNFRKCDLCGQEHMSSYRPDAPFPVYCRDCWYGDKWDRLKNGRDFNFSRPFFEQFAELQKVSPRISLFTGGTIVNSDYCNAVTYIKNCYLTFCTFDSEDCFYSNNLRKNCFQIYDSSELSQSEKCYDCVNCDQCYGLIASDDCRSCRDSFFLQDCHGCHDCFGCTNLRNQQFCFWNKQLNETDYKRELAKIDLRSRQIYLEQKNKFAEFKKHGHYKYYHGFNNLNVTGDYLTYCKNTKESFDCFETEDCKYISRLTGAKDCFDVDWFGNNGLELAYNCSNCGNYSINIKFCNQIWDGCTDIEYSDMCQIGCKNCFGCISLIKREYCIFNKQYSEPEYFKLKEKIIAHMKKTGEYGQFFPAALSHVPYNNSVGYDYYPLTKEEALKGGWRWADEDKKYQPATTELPDKLPADENITKEVFACAKCGRNYKIIPQELTFYQTIGVPLPDQCFNCRLLARLARKNPRTLWGRPCDKCGKMLKTTYAPNRPEKVYCEECYQKEIY